MNIVSKDDHSNIEEFENQLTSDQQLFGFEQWRQTLWGNDLIKQLGCDMLSRLKNQNILAYDDQVNKLKKELNTVLESLNDVSTITKIDYETIRTRLQNALTVIQLVENNLDKIGVAIW